MLPSDAPTSRPVHPESAAHRSLGDYLRPPDPRAGQPVAPAVESAASRPSGTLGRSSTLKRYLVLTGTASLLALGACVHAPTPTEASSSAIRGAEEAGAAEVPVAALHVQLAKEEEEAAKALGESGHDEEATSLLLRATADAELAVVLARAEAAQVAADEAEARTAALSSHTP